MKLPLKVAMVTGLLLLFLGELQGTMMGTREASIKEEMEASVRRHAAVHHLTGDFAKDQEAIEGIVHQSWTWVRRFHVHAEGLGMKLLLVSFLISNLPAVSASLEMILTWCLSIGAFLNPFFWLFIGIFTPRMGAEAALHTFKGLLMLPSTILLLAALLGALWYALGRRSAGSPGG